MPNSIQHLKLWIGWSGLTVTLILGLRALVLPHVSLRNDPVVVPSPLSIKSMIYIQAYALGGNPFEHPTHRDPEADRHVRFSKATLNRRSPVPAISANAL